MALCTQMPRALASDCSPPHPHQQLARGSTLPTQPRPGHAHLCQALSSGPSKAICPIPPALLPARQRNRFFHTTIRCVLLLPEDQGVPIPNACDIRGPTSSLISSSHLPWSPTTLQGQMTFPLLLPLIGDDTHSPLPGKVSLITQRSIFPADSSCSPTPTTCRFPTLLL